MGNQGNRHFGPVPSQGLGILRKPGSSVSVWLREPLAPYPALELAHTAHFMKTKCFAPNAAPQVLLSVMALFAGLFIW